MTLFLNDDIIKSNDSLRNILEVKKLRHWLIELRGNRSQESTAKSIGITRGAYANIELGKRNPSVTLAKRIGDTLNFDWTLFLKKKSSKRNKNQTPHRR